MSSVLPGDILSCHSLELQPKNNLSVSLTDSLLTILLALDGRTLLSLTTVTMPKPTQEDLAFTILWSPLPPITWILPFIGHTGIANSRGVASDFQGPYYVGDQGRMAFGNPTRALKIDISGIPGRNIYKMCAPIGIFSFLFLTRQFVHSGGEARWDAAIEEANNTYRERMHNICCDNCHSHVACALNRMPVKDYGVVQWDMVKICFQIFFRAKFLSWRAVLIQFVPFLILCIVITVMKNLAL
jgi:transmembrane protein 222